MSDFELVTWYDTWNATGLANLQNKQVPLNLASRYNLAFGELGGSPDKGYSVVMTGQFAAQVRQAIEAQAPKATIYAGLGDTGIDLAVADNAQNGNRSTKLIAAWLKTNGYTGISIDAEGDGMSSVVEFVTQLSPYFRSVGFGIAVSVPWPEQGPEGLYGSQTVSAFNKCVSAIELQDYSSSGTPADAAAWTDAGVSAGLLLGGACTENGPYQTSLEDTSSWTTWAVKNGLGGMFSWRLDNDHGSSGEDEDVKPTFVGAKAIFTAANGG